MRGYCLHLSPQDKLIVRANGFAAASLGGYEMHTTKVRIAAGVLSLAALLVVAVGPTSNAASVPAVAVAQPGPSTSLGTSNSAFTALTAQYIVRFKTERGLNQTVADELRVGTDVTDVWSHAIDGFAATLSTTDLARLRNDPDVASIQRDNVVTTAVDQISPPWGLDRIDQRTLPLNGGYSYTTVGSGVTAYVVDTGINTAHTEFNARIVRSAFIDFTGVPGASASETADIEDCNGHGTHVAATLGGTVYGVAKDVSLVPVKVFQCDGTSNDSDIINGLDFVLSDHAAHPGPAVANLSLGGSLSPSLDTAVGNVIADGITVVVAAGNDNVDACNQSPADVTAAITVAASNISDHAASFTNHGSCVDIFAPGVSILSAWIGTSTPATASNVISGTSMAAPHVAGVVARLLELTPAATPAEIWTALDTTATVGVLSVGVGDPNKLLYRLPPIVPSPSFFVTIPSAPRGLVVRPLNESATLTWNMPARDGGSAILGYTTSCAAPGQSTVVNTLTNSPFTVVGLANGVEYSCIVSAENALGVGPASATKTMTPRTTPSAPDAPLIETTNRRLNLTWSAPSNDGGAPIKGYVVSCTDGTTVKIKKTSPSTTTAGLMGLTNGTQYSCTVAAKNAAGTGIESSATLATPRTVPSAPISLGASAASSSATVTFNASASNGGSAVTIYTTTCVSTAAGAATPVVSSGASSPMLVPGLTPGKKYTCKVQATNAVGSSRNSMGKNVTPTP